MYVIYQGEGMNMIDEKMTQLEELLREVKDSYGNRLVQVSSFGAEDMVISHVAWINSIQIPIISMDTGRLHEETHNFIQRVGSIYGLKVRIVFPDSQELEKLLFNKGPTHSMLQWITAKNAAL
jgi:3''-phosphoadenosine 5''-phosphosulfate sulfotransferase (PAPS reductase)/FAD synthetase and related enzymes